MNKVLSVRDLLIKTGIAVMNKNGELRKPTDISKDVQKVLYKLKEDKNKSK